MKKNLLVAVLLSMALFSCKPKVIYVDRPVAPAQSNTPPAPGGDNQPYQPPAGAAYTGAAQNNNNVGQGGDGNVQYYNNNNGSSQNGGNQNSYTESDQQYYANQSQVNYGSPSYQTFYDALSPYGSWVNYQSYGNVWVPAQGADFSPYVSNGQWACTQYGMTWVSNYNWGWAPFHYGSWTLDPFYGWIWIPGNIWAPAQVTWGQYNGYYGWAPMGPGYYSGYVAPANCWTFVPQGQITQPNVYRFASPGHRTPGVSDNIRNIQVINNTGTYNNAIYNAGPHREEIEKVTGHPVPVVSIAESDKPVPAGRAMSGSSLSVYRPAIPQATAAHAAPAHVVPIEQVKEENARAVGGIMPGHQGYVSHAAQGNQSHSVQPQPDAPRPGATHSGEPQNPGAGEHRYTQHQNDAAPAEHKQSPNPNSGRPANPKPRPQPKAPSRPAAPEHR